MPALGLEISHIDHLVIATERMEAMLRFYELLPGVRPVREHGRYALHFGRQKLNLHPYPSALAPLAANPEPGGRGFCLAVAGAGLQDKLAEAGIQILKDCCPCDALSRAVYDVFYVSDPDGNLIQLQCDSEAPEERVAAIKSVSLRVRDPLASTKFYESLPGLSMRPYGAITILRFSAGQIWLDGGACCGLAYGRGDFCLLAEGDIEAFFEGLLRVGAPLVEGLGIVERTGAQGPIKSVYLRDPDGNLVEIGTPRK